MSQQTITKEEAKTVESLIKLGDNKKLAIDTVIANRENKAKQDASKQLYYKAYHL